MRVHKITWYSTVVCSSKLFGSNIIIEGRLMCGFKIKDN
jgi:hypothetical protein